MVHSNFFASPLQLLAVVGERFRSNNVGSRAILLFGLLLCFSSIASFDMRQRRILQKIEEEKEKGKEEEKEGKQKERSRYQCFTNLEASGTHDNALFHGLGADAMQQPTEVFFFAPQLALSVQPQPEADDFTVLRGLQNFYSVRRHPVRRRKKRVTRDVTSDSV